MWKRLALLESLAKSIQPEEPGRGQDDEVEMHARRRRQVEEPGGRDAGHDEALHVVVGEARLRAPHRSAGGRAR